MKSVKLEQFDATVEPYKVDGKVYATTFALGRYFLVDPEDYLGDAAKVKAALEGMLSTFVNKVPELGWSVRRKGATDSRGGVIKAINRRTNIIDVDFPDGAGVSKIHWQDLEYI